MKSSGYVERRASQTPTPALLTCAKPAEAGVPERRLQPALGKERGQVLNSYSKFLSLFAASTINRPKDMKTMNLNLGLLPFVPSFVCAALLGLESGSAQTIAITNITISGSNALLQMSQPYDRFIVEKFLTWGQPSVCWASSAGTLTNQIKVALDTNPMGFFRLQFGIQAVRFDDRTLELDIRGLIAQKRKPVNAVYDVDLAGIFQLSAPNQTVNSLTGLEFCRNLSELDLSQNFIKDLTPLHGLSSLATVNLNDNFIEDLAPLGSAYLANLNVLWLNNNLITNVAPLKPLLGLRNLSLSANRISDAGPLGALTNLSGLELDYNHIANLEPLATLINLSRLGLEGNGLVADLTALSGLTALTSLDLAGNQIQDVAPLSTLVRLNWLELQWNQITNVAPLASLQKLSVNLNLTQNRIQDVTPLASLVKLTGLHLGINKISDLSALSQLIWLTSLDLNDNRIGNLDALTNLTRLTGLSLENNLITDLGPLVANASQGGLKGAWIDVRGNPLGQFAQTNQIPILRYTYGVTVYWP